MALELAKDLRLKLKKQAHHLKPIIQTGAAGVSEAVIAELDRALFDHELVKIKLSSDDKKTRHADIEKLCTALEAACVQQIGRTATLYRPRPNA